MRALPAEKVALASFYYDEKTMGPPDERHEQRADFLVFGSYRHNGVCEWSFSQVSFVLFSDPGNTTKGHKY